MTPQDGGKYLRSLLLILKMSVNMSAEVTYEPMPPPETFLFWDLCIHRCCYPANYLIGGGSSSSSV